jgi:hypothetical protein
VFIALGNFPGGGSIYDRPFVVDAWVVVRDLSNLFFILILLYIAIKIILGLSGADGKKMIARVIIVALLINFSMFFTYVVIDSSNVLALIFYNKIVTVVTANGAEYEKVGGESDISGALIGKLMLNKITDPAMNEAAKAITIPGAFSSVATIGLGTLGISIALMTMGGALFLLAIFIFIIIILAFLNRIVTLIILTIFSPFALMSSTIPILNKVEFVGWEDWTKRLLKTAFFAPIFMFMIYLIFLLINSSLLENIVDTSNGNFINKILSLVFGLSVVLALLYVALKFAFTASGKAGEMVVKAGKAALVVGAAVATAGAGLAISGAVGGAASKVLSNTGIQRAAALGDKGAQFKLLAASKLKKVDFTEVIHGVTGGKMRSGAVSKIGEFTGINTKGGYEGIVERKVKSTREMSELVKTKMTDRETREYMAEGGNEYDRNKKTFENNHKNEREEYYKKKEEEKEAHLENMEKTSGGEMDRDATEKAFNENYTKNHPEPMRFEEIYGAKPENTAQLNNFRMKTFQENLGNKGSLMGSMAPGEYGKEKFARELEKEISQMKDVSNLLEKSTKELEGIHEVLEEGVRSGYMNGNKESGFTPTEKLETQLALLTATANQQKADLEVLIKQGDKDKAEKTATSLANTNTKIAKLQELKTGQEKASQLQTATYKLRKDKNQLMKEQSGTGKQAEKKKEGTAPKTPPTPTPTPTTSTPK